MEYKTLGEICDVVSGGTPSRSKQEYWNGDIPWIKIGNIKSKYVSEADEFITEAGLSGSSAKMLKKGTILYTIFATLGEAGVLTIDACTNQAIAGISIKDESVIDRDYLFYYLKSKKNYVNEVGRGVAQNNINMSILRGFKVPIRKLYEQQEITKILDKTASIIEDRKKELDKLDELIKARFVELYNNSSLGEETTLEAITERVKVGFVGTCEKYYTDASGIPMLRTGNITDKGIDLSDLKYVTPEFHGKNKKSQIHEGDLLIARHGSNGQANVYYGQEAQCLNVVVIVPNYEMTTSIFLAGLINSPIVKEQIERTLVGSTQHVVNTKSIAGLVVRIPDLTVQKEYEAFVKQVDKSKVAVQKSLAETQKLFDSLMQEYFG